ncbi:hypothetical protein C1H76_4600 [Elsinoe australis]|uniref:Uncharacterized protein n=1 Tax=Elsinoe australis TaxID=40998 RepID=A0A4U7B354_9PEZI|nr:hypothetical protein C1H76_4600 [Elsinoe australis]
MANTNTHGPIVKPEPTQDSNIMAPPRTSADYAFCFAGAGYDHGIPVEYQSNYWLPCPRFRTAELNRDSKPFSIQDEARYLEESLSEDMDIYLWVGMAIEPRLGICADVRYGYDGFISNLKNRRIEPRREKQFPVIVREHGTDQVTLRTYALVKLEDEGVAWEARLIKQQEVFFFTPYRDTVDQILYPRERKLAWYGRIKRSLGFIQDCSQADGESDTSERLEESDDGDEDTEQDDDENDVSDTERLDDASGEALEEASQDRREEQEDDVMQLSSIADEGEKPVTKRRSTRGVARSKDYQDPPVAKRRLTRVTARQHDSRRSEPAVARQDTPAASSLFIANSEVTPVEFQTDTSTQNSSKPKQAPHAATHTEANTDYLSTGLRDCLSSLNHLIEAAERFSGGPDSRIPGAAREWLVNFTHTIRYLDSTQASISLQESVRVGGIVLRAVIGDARLHNNAHPVTPVANEAFLEWVMEEVAKLEGTGRKEDGASL